MKIAKLVLAAVVGIAGAAVISTQVYAAGAPGDTATCKTSMKSVYDPSDFNTNNGKVSINVVVVGNAQCRKNYVLASFKIPHNTLKAEPVELQKLYDHTVLRNVGPGTYKMTVNVPNCFHQVDLALGTNPTGPNGKLPYEPNRLLNAYLGGNKKCDTTPDKPEKPDKPDKPTKPDEPNKPVKVVKTTVVTNHATVVKTLTVTGPEAVAGIGGVTTVLSAGAHMLIRRRFF